MRAAVATVLMGLWLAGCASNSVSIRSLPAQAPAADNAAAAQNAAAFAGAIANASENNTGVKAASGNAADKDQAPPVTAQDAPSLTTYDPWERLNRFTYRFNARFDEAIFLPTANAYRRVPTPIRAGVHNFFANLTEVQSVLNYALQGRLGAGARSLGRFAINSTLGLGGLFDVAKKIDLPAAPTGFSNTLARYGIHPGPYLIIPLLGPSTLRDGVGFLGDFSTTYAINVANLYRGDPSWGLDVANAIDQRANINFRYYASGSPFEYGTIRFLFVRKRLIEDQALRSKNWKRGDKSTTQQENESNQPAGK
jgi:phospholipid-binding lipoprotein MlaA